MPASSSVAGLSGFLETQLGLPAGAFGCSTIITPALLRAQEDLEGISLELPVLRSDLFQSCLTCLFRRDARVSPTFGPGIGSTDSFAVKTSSARDLSMA
jgi:hypothetical protein